MLDSFLQQLSEQSRTPPKVGVMEAELTPTEVTPNAEGLLDAEEAMEPDAPGEHDDDDDDGHDHGAGTTDDHGWQNGRIPLEELTDIGNGHRLEAKAAAAWQRMVADAAKQGVNLTLTDSYRDFDAQVAVRKNKGHAVATAKPGTSVHGWGRAVDANVRDPKALGWLRANAPRYGWVNPAWAQKSGKSFEPWHWEYKGAKSDG